MAYLEAERLTAAGDYAEAWKALAPIAVAHADVAPAQLLACQLAAQPTVTDPTAEKACEVAAKLMPQDSLPLILLAWARINDAAAEKARPARRGIHRAAALLAADDALARLKARDDVPARWVQLAGAYQALSAVTRAQEAIAHAPDASGAPAIQTWIQDTRLWAAPTGVDPAKEPAYVESFWTLYQGLSPSTAKTTLQSVDAALKENPGAPGLLSLRCGALVYLDKLDQAKKACDQAIALEPDTLFARLGAAHIARRRKDPAGARKHLEHVIDVAPDLEQAWTDLGEVLEDDAAALGELKRRYREVRKKSWPY
jgi:tetratricopeptide (TPR) repeat protein